MYNNYYIDTIVIKICRINGGVYVLENPQDLNLKDLEKELCSILGKEKEDWIKLYIDIENIQNKELWKPHYRSFSAWLKTFCIKNKFAEATIWNKKRAGEIYKNYMEHQLNQGKQVKPIENIKISYDTILKIGQISNGDYDKMEKWIDNISHGKKTVISLGEALRTYKVEMGRKVVEEREDNNGKSASGNSSITATDIVTILNNPLWLDEMDARNLQVKFFKSFLEKDVYRTCTEFPVVTTSAKSPRRMDVLVVENLTSKNVYKLFFHCIEIKVNEYDLRNDKKFGEYADFVDRMWLAVPIELVEIAKEVKFEGCGIIAIKDDKTTIVEKAELLQPQSKESLMNTLLLKFI